MGIVDTLKSLFSDSGQATAQVAFNDNLATVLSPESLKTIGTTVREDYDTDLKSRDKWDTKRVRWLKLLAGERDPKNFPWPGCSNIHVPIMGVACLQFQARAYEALLPPKEYAKCWATDGTSMDAASRCQRHINWQLTEQMDEWEEDMDITMLQIPLNGVAFKKTYFDPIKKRPVSRVIGVDNFVVPYKCKRLEDTSRKTHAYYMYVNDIQKHGQAGFFINTKSLTDGNAQVDKPSSDQEQVNAKISGIEQVDTKDTKMRLLLEQHRGWDLDGDGIEEDYIITVDDETDEVLRIETREYMDPLDGQRKTLEYFTAYPFIPNPESVYGFGFGHFLEGLNESASTIINQLIDAGTLANAQAGFVNRRAGIKGNLDLVPGELQSVDLNADDIRKAIYMVEYKEPSQALFALLGLIREFSKEISSVSESMMGKLPPSDTTATTMLAVMEQGLKVFSTIHKRLHRSFRRELKKIFRLNSLYLNEKVYYTVQDSTSGEMQSYQSGKNDYSNNIDIIPVSDPTITSRAEKLIKSRQAYEIGMGNPLISSDPESMYELTKQFYEAIEVQNVDKIVKKPKPVDPPDLHPLEENALFLQEKYTKPLPHQNHMEHLQAHDDFAVSPWAEKLPPNGKKALQMHIQETFSLAYMAEQQQRAQALMAQVEEVMQSGGNGGAVGRMGPSAAYARSISAIGAEKGRA